VAVAVGNNYEATDIAPNAGHVKVGGTGSVAPYSPTVSLQSLRARNWGGGWNVRR
jgi:hypothetical protein